MGKMNEGKIRVLQFIHSSAVTGPGRIVYGLASNLDKKEFSCDVICPENGPLADGLKKAGTTVIPFDPADLRSPLSLMKLLGRIKGYHILHIHSGQYSAFWKIFGRLAGIPGIVYTEHVLGAGHDWIRNTLALRLHLASHAITDAATDRVIAVSDHARGQFIRRQRMSPAKVVTIHNGVDGALLQRGRADIGALRGELGIPDGCAVVGMVARFFPEKGHRILVQAAGEIVKERPAVRFLLVGEGPERQAVESMITSFGLKDHFILTGFSDDAAAFIDCMDIVVQPSLAVSEAFGLTVVEAMARGKAVIVSDIGCFREIVESGRDGLIFPAQDSAALKKSVMMLLDDKILRERLGAAAREKVAAQFEIRAMAKRTGELYEDILASKSARLS